MVRSLYSGVAGMTTHQTKMDVIGNNISNVSTYGYKSSRAAFKDVYYQTNNTAMAATPTSGGTNPKQIGYGAKLGSVDVNHSQSVMSNTGYTLDVAIAGEGYLQVMDADGNIFYTKAGMLDIDADGNLVDINGYFVLGVSGQPTGQNPGSNRIKVDLPYQSAAAAKAEDTINDIGYTVEAENQNEDGNVNIVFETSNNMPFGQRMSASITSASIIVTVNANELFTDMADFNKEMNLAITSANGGVRHKAGDFTITSTVPDSDLFGVDADGDGTISAAEMKPLTGAEIVEPDFSVNTGSVTFSDDLKTFFGVKSVGDEFGGLPANATLAPDFTAVDPSGQTGVRFTIGNYEGFVPSTNFKAGSVLMKNTAAGASSADSFVMTYPNLGTLSLNGVTDFGVTGVASEPSRNLGLGDANFLLKGGTEGGEQTVADLTGISINDKGVLIAEHPTLGSLELGRIDLATFANPAGLSQVGDTYFAESRNSGEPIIAVAGTEGTGDILGGTLETSNTDLAHEMADMIVTQRGFQACSRMITVSDSMLEELINLKR